MNRAGKCSLRSQRVRARGDARFLAKRAHKRLARDTRQARCQPLPFVLFQHGRLHVGPHQAFQVREGRGGGMPLGAVRELQRRRDERWQRLDAGRVLTRQKPGQRRMWPQRARVRRANRRKQTGKGVVEAWRRLRGGQRAPCELVTPAANEPLWNAGQARRAHFRSRCSESPSSTVARTLR